MAEENSYLVEFEFTTFRNSSITGRKGSIVINTKLSIDEAWKDEDEIKQIAFMEIQRLKPKWQVISLTIKNISHDKKKATRNIKNRLPKS